MGKSQKKKAMRRHNPARVPDDHLGHGLDAAGSSASPNKRNAILPVIQKLDSPEAQDRTWACSAVTNLIHNDPSTRRLLQGKNIVGILIKKMSDDVDEVVVEASGALRNLCIDGGYDICGEMYNKGILPPLQASLPKITNALDQLLTSPQTAPENAADLVLVFAENVITILWCLSETSRKALNAINEINLVPFLMAFLENREKLTLQVLSAAAQCLYVLTDDNTPAIEEVRQNSTYTSCLLALGDSSQPIVTASGPSPSTDHRAVAVKVLSAGTLKNISPLPHPSIHASIDIERTVVVPLLVPVISTAQLNEAANEALQLSSQSEPVEIKQDRHVPCSDHKSPAELGLERIEGHLRNVQLALEIMTSVCATLPDPESALPKTEEGAINGVQDSDAEEVIEDAEMKVEEDEDVKPAINGDLSIKVEEAEDVKPDINDDLNINASLLPSILKPLLTLVQPTSLSFPPLSGSPSPHPPTTSVLSAIHIRALECLNNIFLSLSVAPSPQIQAEVQSGLEVWNAIWSALGVVGLQGGSGQERRREVWEVAIGVLWCIGNIWKGSIVPESEHVEVLIKLCDSTEDVQLKVKCIGTLECLAQHGPSVEANLVIANYLISIIIPLPSTIVAEPIFQAASALIDIYSDENSPYDINFRQHGFLETLKNCIDSVRRALKTVDRKKQGGRSLKRRGEEVLENLVAFVQYRRELKL